MALVGSDFSEAVLDGVNFSGSDLTGVSFKSSMLFECNFIDANLDGADFIGVDPDIDIIAKSADGAESVLSGKHAIGYLRFAGASTDYIDNFYIYSNHRLFPIIAKISEKLTTNRNNQLRGLTQRGEAQVDPRFARAFVDRLNQLGWSEVDKNQLVSITALGRSALGKLVDAETMADEVSAFISSWR
ncbi:hypothetical protein ASG07_12030 [Sphingomonas sp. Leaf343]|nr:hypothetical protein ASG07_12030 [Sphingomonas sp. Leaf343]